MKRRPNVLILDEPTNHMDIVGKETLESMLKDYTGTLIFVSHDRYFVRKVANRLLVFEDGTTHLYQFGYEEYQEKLDREAAERGDDYRKNPAALGGVISQNGAAGVTSAGTAFLAGSTAGVSGNDFSNANSRGVNSKGTGTDAGAASTAGGTSAASAGTGAASGNSFSGTGGKRGYYNPGKERSKIEKKIKKAEDELAVKEEKLEELKAELLRPEYQSSYTKLTEIQAEIDAMEEEIMADMENWEELSQQLEELTSGELA